MILVIIGLTVMLVLCFYIIFKLKKEVVQAKVKYYVTLGELVNLKNSLKPKIKVPKGAFQLIDFKLDLTIFK